MECADGVRLASRIWCPEGQGPWPVLLMRQPYGSALASTITYAHPRWYAAHGFLVVVQDVRGRGESEGTFRGFAQEAADGAEAVRWARRLPKSNGRLGTYGFSYQGLSQVLNSGLPQASPERGRGSADPDPLPDCLAPAMCGLNERLDWASEGGAHWWALGLGWALQLAAQGAQRRGDAQGWEALRSSLESGAYLHRGLALLEEHDPDGMGLAWLRADPQAADGWRVHQPAAALLQRPMLLIGGWHDPHLRGVLELWRRATAAGGRPSLQVGAWSHLQWQGGIDREQLAFFRRHLLDTPGPQVPWQREATGKTTGNPSGVATGEPSLRSTGPGDIWLQDATTGRWFPMSPAPPAPGPRWRLDSDGRAAICSDEGRLLREGEGDLVRPVVLVHDPWRPVPARGGHLGGEASLADRTDLDRRGDVACFTTAPLKHPLQLLGRPVLRLRVQADQPGFDLCAALAVVSADAQTTRQLCTGMRRILGSEATEPLERCVELQPLAATLQAGERLRLSLAPAAWPHLAVNGGDGRQPRGGSSAAHRIITLTLELEGAELVIHPLLPPPPDGEVAALAAN
jgi:putative CocE/NonD family hydrolase